MIINISRPLLYTRLVIIVLPDYTKKENIILAHLQTQLKPALDKAFETFCKAEEEFAKLDTDAQQEKRSAVTRKAEARDS